MEAVYLVHEDYVHGIGSRYTWYRKSPVLALSCGLDPGDVHEPTHHVGLKAVVWSVVKVVVELVSLALYTTGLICS